MLRRAVTALVAVGMAAFLFAGCGVLGSSPAAQEAERLLEGAALAQAKLESMTFRVRIKGELEGQAVAMTLDGGAYLKGDRAGDVYVDAHVSAPGVPPQELTMVVLGGTLSMKLDGRWQSLPVPAGGQAGVDQTLETELSSFDLSRFVRDLDVDDETTFLGEPVTKISGTIDLEGLMKELLGGIGSVAPLEESALRSQLPGSLGPTRVAVYVSNVTHLVRAAHVSLKVTAQGQTMTMTMDYSLQTVDEPVPIPTPAATAA